jgi:predicted nucleotidyltransferase
MPQKLNEKYKRAAWEFSRRVTSALGDQVDAIVLYGSVARGEARRDSDIDILVVSPDPPSIREALSEIRSDFAYEQDYAFFVSLLHYSREELCHLQQMRSPFLREITKDGMILYDSGTFSRVRAEGIAASR